jgi:hypothetical protein
MPYLLLVDHDGGEAVGGCCLLRAFFYGVAFPVSERSSPDKLQFAGIAANMSSQSYPIESPIGRWRVAVEKKHPTGRAISRPASVNGAHGTILIGVNIHKIDRQEGSSGRRRSDRPFRHVLHCTGIHPPTMSDLPPPTECSSHEAACENKQSARPARNDTHYRSTGQDGCVVQVDPGQRLDSKALTDWDGACRWLRLALSGDLAQHSPAPQHSPV